MGDQMVRLSEDTSAIYIHLLKIDPSVFDGVILGPLYGQFENVLESQTDNANRAQDNLWQASNAIYGAANYYRETDRAQAAVFDATIPDSKTLPWTGIPESTDKPNVPAYAYVNDPQGRLNEPPSYEEEMSWKPSLESDIYNVPSAIRSVIQFVIGVDPLQKVEETIGGRWPEVRQISDRFNNAAWAFRDCADNIQNWQISSQKDWTGDAADSARNYLVLLANGFYGEYLRNEYLADQVKSLAEGAFETMKVLADIASDWINGKLLPALLSILKAGGVEEVPFLDLVMDGAAGYKVYEVIHAGLEVYDQANKINNMIEALRNAFNLLLNNTLPTAAPLMPTNIWIPPVAG